VSPATFSELFREFFGVLEPLGIEYFAYGGVSVAVWGAPRETVDVDTVLCVAEERIPELLKALERAGFTCTEEEKATFPIDGWLRMSFRGRHADLTLGRTPFDQSALRRRRCVKLFGLDVWVVSAVDLILYKLVAHRYKDLGDAESVLVRSRGRLDLAYVRRWADEIARGTGKFEVPARLKELIDRTVS
jgi:hypothetical protein